MKSFAAAKIRAAVLAGAAFTIPAIAHAQYSSPIEPNYRYDHDNEYDEDYQDDFDRREQRLAGEVTRVWGRNSIEIRSGRRYFTVRLQEEADSRFLTPGDYVILAGEWQGSSFVAERLRGGREDDWNQEDENRRGGTRRVDFSSWIVRIFSSREIEVWGDNGRYYRVHVREGVRGFSPNSRVRIVGFSTGNRIRVDRLFGANGGVVPGRPTNSTFVDFPARIQSVNLGRYMATALGDNGRTYQIRYHSLNDFRPGDRVRIIGSYQKGIVEVSRLLRVR